jgi:hypothetical protein
LKAPILGDAMIDRKDRRRRNSIVSKLMPNSRQELCCKNTKKIFPGQNFVEQFKASTIRGRISHPNKVNKFDSP